MSPSVIFDIVIFIFFLQNHPFLLHKDDLGKWRESLLAKNYFTKVTIFRIKTERVSFLQCTGRLSHVLLFLLSFVIELQRFHTWIWRFSPASTFWPKLKENPPTSFSLSLSALLLQVLGFLFYSWSTSTLHGMKMEQSVLLRRSNWYLFLVAAVLANDRP